MAALRGGEEPSLWLERSANDSSNDLSGDDIEQLRSTYGDGTVELIERTLASTYSTDFEGASDDQIIAVVKELVTSSASQSATAELPEAGNDFDPPPDEELVAAVVAGILDDPEFLAALNAQWQVQVEVPPDAATAVVEELVELIKAGVWQGLEEVISELGDNVPNEAQFIAAAAELGLA